MLADSMTQQWNRMDGGVHEKLQTRGKRRDDSHVDLL